MNIEYLYFVIAKSRTKLLTSESNYVDVDNSKMFDENYYVKYFESFPEIEVNMVHNNLWGFSDFLTSWKINKQNLRKIKLKAIEGNYNYVELVKLFCDSKIIHFCAEKPYYGCTCGIAGQDENFENPFLAILSEIKIININEISE